LFNVTVMSHRDNQSVPRGVLTKALALHESTTKLGHASAFSYRRLPHCGCRFSSVSFARRSAAIVFPFANVGRHFSRGNSHPSRGRACGRIATKQNRRGFLFGFGSSKCHSWRYRAKARAVLRELCMGIAAWGIHRASMAAIFVAELANSSFNATVKGRGNFPPPRAAR
jgi:hypothetical protein